MKTIDTSKIRGKYTALDCKGNIIGAGDETFESLKIIAEKLNEVIRYIMLNED